MEELSEKLGIEKLTIRKFFKEGRLKGRKVANRWYITAESLKAFFEDGEEIDK